MKKTTLIIWLAILCINFSFAKEGTSIGMNKKENDKRQIFSIFSVLDVTQNAVNSPNCTAPIPNVNSLPDVIAQCSATLTAPTATSDCAGQITGTTFDPTTYDEQGTYSVLWLYDDGNGNISTQSQTVIISDTLAPVPNIETLPNVVGQCFAFLTAPTATDNCSGTVTATTNSPFLYSTQGVYTITWTYEDANGNTSSQNQTIIISDTTAPVPNLTTLATVKRQCFAAVSTPTATDYCNGTIFGTTSNPLSYTNQGTYVITWTYTDAQGNSSTQQQTVILDDTIAPVAALASLPTITAECFTTVTTTPTANDNCAGVITATTSSPLSYNTAGTHVIVWTYDDGNGNTSTQNQTVVITTGGDLVTYYIDADGDGFGSEASIIESCSQPEGYVDNDGDCDDTQLQYEDNDGDGFGTNVLVGCGAPNNLDCDDTNPDLTEGIPYFIDADGDGFGSEASIIFACSPPEGYVDNDGDCDDNEIQYEDLDQDGFGSTILAGCGVTNSDDCDDNDMSVSSFVFYQDADGDGFGNSEVSIFACSQPEGYVDNDDDCDDTQILYTDEDGDGFGTPIPAPCGATNSIDCNDADPEQHGPVTYYQDNDGDGFGDFSISLTTCFQPFGYVPNFMDCNDNQIQYEDLDEDGFGSDVIVGCGVGNSDDCDDNQIQFEDLDGDGYGSSNYAGCGVLNTDDCDDTNAAYHSVALYYQDLDNDGFGNANEVIISCFPVIGYVLNDTDCNDTEIQYQDNDGDGFGSDVVVPCGVTNSDDPDDNDPDNGGTTYYEDLDGDGFGNPAVSVVAPTQPVGYVTDNTDCNDNLLTYADADGDGFGSTTLVACGVTNNTDCNDNQIQYQDLDNDGFGSTIQVACGVTNSDDCNDNLLTYADADGDGFGSTTLVACGVTNNTDCNDNQIQYLDADGDGFGSTTQVACGVTNNTDCNDNQIQYQDLDGDGFGSLIQVACGVTNTTDCNDNQIQYLDADGDGFGSTTQVACGVTNNADCNDNQLQYADVDGDGFGSTTLVACGVTNNTDCNDNQIQYQDLDGDGFGSLIQVACGVTNHTDCNDNLLTYADADGDGFGSTTLVACGVTNNTDCNDNQIQYQDLDGDGFGSLIQVACGVTNHTDCNDNLLTYADADNDGFGSTTLVPCGVSNNTDCNDHQILYQDSDGDGFGTTVMVACGGSVYSSDCDDTNAGIRPVLAVTMNQAIYANNVAGAQMYRFRITNLTTNEIRTIDRALRTFNLTQIDNYAYNTVFYVEVAVRLNNVWSDFSRIPACSVVTPMATTKLQTSQCGITINDLHTSLYADNVNYVLGYRFRVTDANNPNDTQEYDTPLRNFKLSLLNNIQLNKTYNIEVSLKNNDGTYLPYGPSCTVTTVTKKTQERVVENAFSATVAPNPFVDTFSLRLENTDAETIKIDVYDLLGRSIESKTFDKNELESIAFGTNYPTGVYTLIVTVGDEIKNIRIVKR